MLSAPTWVAGRCPRHAWNVRARARRLTVKGGRIAAPSQVSELRLVRRSVRRVAMLSTLDREGARETLRGRQHSRRTRVHRL